MKIASCFAYVYSTTFSRNLVYYAFYFLLINSDTKNGIATHVMENDHKIQSEEAQVIASELHLTKTKVNESLLISRAPNSMNLDKGLQLDMIIFGTLQ